MQKGCQALLPEIESRLQAKLQWLIGLFDFKGKCHTLACPCMSFSSASLYRTIFAAILKQAC